MNDTLFEDAVETTALTTVPATNPLAILAAAVERGADPDQLEKLLALQERYERNEAAREFAAALATFQQKCPPIHKGRTAGSGNFAYGYAAYEDVWAIAGPILAEVGITVSYSTEPHERGVMGTVFLRKGVHVETRTKFVPIPDMKVNDTQKHGAASSYVKRYLLGDALNLIFTDEDNDAQGLIETITDLQVVEIEAYMSEHNLPLPSFLRYLEIDRLAEIPAAELPDAWSVLRKKVKDRQNANR